MCNSSAGLHGNGDAHRLIRGGASSGESGAQSAAVLKEESSNMFSNMSVYHPKNLRLGLLSKRVTHISSAVIRCSVATESGNVATWLEELLIHATVHLEHPAQSFSEFSVDRIISLHTCTLYVVARLESGALYWWGVLPFGQRKRLAEIVCGSQVCMKNSPIYQPGAIGFTISGGVPKVGQLLNAAWNLTDVGRFKLLNTNVPDQQRRDAPSSAATLPAPSSSKSNSHKETADRLDMPPPPSPASSTCSDTGSITTSHSRVLKGDGAHVAVRFPSNKDTKETKEMSSDDTINLLQDCLLMRKDELQVIKSGATSRAPDCFQWFPRRVNVAEGGQIITLTVDGVGIHAVVKNNSKLSYVIYNLSTGRTSEPVSIRYKLLLDLDPQNISLISAGEVNIYNQWLFV